MMSTEQRIFGGVYAATVCPLRDDFSPDEAALAAHCRAVSEVRGIRGLLVNGHAAALIFFGGLALIVGLLVRPAAAVLAFTMAVAIFAVHIGNGLFMSNDGYEFGLALLAVSISLAISGAGRASVDRLLAGPRD